MTLLGHMLPGYHYSATCCQNGSAQPYVAKVPLLGYILLGWHNYKLNNLRYEILPQSPYSFDPTIIFSSIWTRSYAKNIPFQRRSRNYIQIFLRTKTVRGWLYNHKNLVNRLQKGIDVQGSYFDWLKNCGNSFRNKSLFQDSPLFSEQTNKYVITHFILAPHRRVIITKIVLQTFSYSCQFEPSWSL